MDELIKLNGFFFFLVVSLVVIDKRFLRNFYFDKTFWLTLSKIDGRITYRKTKESFFKQYVKRSRKKCDQGLFIINRKVNLIPYKQKV